MPSFCASKGRYHFEAHDLKKSKVPTSIKGLGVPTSIKCTTDATRVVAPLHVHTITNTMSATTAFFAVRAPSASPSLSAPLGCALARSAPPSTPRDAVIDDDDDDDD